MNLNFTLAAARARQLLLILCLLGSLQSFSQNDSWTQQPDNNTTLPTGAECTFTITDKAYTTFSGQYVDNAYSKSFWEYDTKTGTWTQKADFGGAGRQFAATFSINNKGYIGMGMKGPNTRDLVSDFWEYDATTNAWTRKADLPSSSAGRFGGLGFSISSKGYMGGGFDWFSLYNDINEYDPTTNVWTRKVYFDTAFYFGTSFTVGNKAYIGLGAKGIQIDNMTSQFVEFDPVTNKISKIAEFPGGKRVFAQSFGLNGKGYLTSGNNENDFWQYDPLTNKWLRKTDFPGAPASRAIAYSIGDKGYVGSAGGTSHEFWRYEVKSTEALKVIFTGKTFINLDWENFNSTNPIISYDVYLNGVKKYTTAESEITADNLLPNSSYTFTVVGKDAYGTSTPTSDALTASTTSESTGLNYRYYEGTWSSLPNFNTLTSQNNGVSTNIDITTRPSGKNDHFGFVWEGYLNIPVAGNYIFETVSGDGSRFYYNSFYNPYLIPLINNDGIHAPVTPVTGTVNVPSAGRYPVALSFFNRDGSAAVQLYWTGPAGSGINRQPVPAAAFTPVYNPLSDTEAPSAPSNLTAVIVARNYVNLKWDNATDNIGVAFYDVYVNGIKKVTTTATQITVDSLVQNTGYNFTVKARDVAGNTSAFSNQVTVTTTNTTNGLSYRFYQGNWNALPDFNSLTPVKTGVSANADISVRPAGVNDYFGFVWEGTINIPYPGTYKFETISDDGSKIYFNSFYSLTAVPVVNNDGVHGPWDAVTGTVNVPSAGQYPIAITFFEKDSGEKLQLYWTGPPGSGIDRQLIPDYAFNGGYVAPLDTIAPTAPTNLQVQQISRNSIGLSWYPSYDNKAVDAYDIFINGVKKYSTANTAITADSLTENTSYTFTIKARDIAGNISASSNIVTASTSSTVNGVEYRYYEGDWNTLPDFSQLTPVKTGVSSNIDITQRRPGVNDHFGFVWQGKINIVTPGTYTFELLSDDGSKFFFNSGYSYTATPLINNDGLHGANTPVVATVNIPAAGLYPFAASFFEKDGGESMQLYWTGPAGSGITRQLVPDFAFNGGSANVIDVTPPTAPTNLLVLATTTDMASLHWTISTDNVGVTAYDVYVNGEKKYTTINNELIADHLAVNTSYTFTVKAVDKAGNNSAVSNAVTKTTFNNDKGISWRYYDGNWNSLPDFNSLYMGNIGFSKNFDLSVRPKGHDDYFGFVWEGTIKMPTSGNYTFELESDDGSRFYFNSLYSTYATPLINNDGLHGAFQPVAGTVNVPAAGKYSFALSYFEKDGGESMKLYWTGPAGSGITRQLVPDSVFISTDVVNPNPPAAPNNLGFIGVNATAIKIGWDEFILRPEVASYEIYINGEKKDTTSARQYIARNLLPFTYYSFAVAAVNFAGVRSALTKEITIRTAQVEDGLFYQYYEGSWDALPNFSTLTPVKSGTTASPDIAIRPAGRNDNFAFAWQGYIMIPRAGVYTFETISDDGSRVFLGGSSTPLVDNDGLHAAISVTGTATLNNAFYPISISYFEKTGGESFQLYWSGPGIPRQIIPASSFVRIPYIGWFPDAAVDKPLNATALAADKDASIRVYPNPFKEGFQVEFDNKVASAKINVEVYDMSGRLVLSNTGVATVGRNMLSVPLKNKSVLPGFYLVRLQVNGKVIKTFKMIKSK